MELAVVTGGGTGIGLAIARSLADAGLGVIVVGRRKEKLTEALDTIGGSAQAFVGDISRPEDVRALADLVRAADAPLRAIVNNAGSAPGPSSLQLDGAAEEFDRVIGVNLKGGYLVIAGLADLLLRPGGHIVNVTSIGPYTGSGGAAYSASKAGMHGMTTALAKELGPSGVTVNAVAPGFVETDMTSDVPSAHIAEVHAAIPLRRSGSPEEVGAVVGFLCSKAGGYINGQVIAVCGGKVFGR